MNNFLDLAKKRHSSRSFLSDKISQKEIKSVIEAGVCAPSAYGRKPWKFFVLTAQEKISLLSQEIMAIKKKLNTGIFRELKDPIFYEAPCVILICIENDNEYNEMDAAFCAQNCFLQAANINLATCAIGSVKFLEKLPHIKEKIGLPKKWKVILGFCLGKENSSKIPPKNYLAEILFQST